MIRLVDESQYNNLLEFCCDNVFGCKIISLFNAYGCNTNFLYFWLQYDSLGNTTCAICKFDNSITICASNNFDQEEIIQYIYMLSPSSICVPYGVINQIQGYTSTYGDIMHFESKASIDKLKIDIPKLKDVYGLLSLCKSNDFNIPDFDSFYVDTSHRIRHNASRCYGIYNKHHDELIASALTVSETDTYSIIGAVAVHPDYRKKGLGSYIVLALVSRLELENKNVYLFCNSVNNKVFYEKIGFKACNKWQEFYKIV